LYREPGKHFALKMGFAGGAKSIFRRTQKSRRRQPGETPAGRRRPILYPPEAGQERIKPNHMAHAALA